MMRRSDVYLLAVLLVGGGCEAHEANDEPSAPAAVALAPANPAPGTRARVENRLPQSSTPPVGAPASARVDNPCGGIFVSVTMHASSLDGSSDPTRVEDGLRSAADELLAGSGGKASNRVEVSPAIFSFRVAAPDSATASAMLRRARSDSRVAAAELDNCQFRRGGKQSRQ